MATQSTGRIVASVMARFGEPITLADGSEVQGIFDPIGDQAAPLMAGDVGLIGRVSGQPNPTVVVTAEIGSLIVEGAALSARGVSYLAVRGDPDHTGMTLVTLVPAVAVNPDTLARLR